MKYIQAFISGALATLALGAAAQCMSEGGLTPAVKIFDSKTRALIADCAVTITLLDGHRIMCQRR